MKPDHKTPMRSINDTVVRSFPEIQAVYLFGSRADGNERDESDYDLALLLPPGRRPDTHEKRMRDCAFEIAEISGHDVDMINLRSASTVMQNEIVSSGRLIYEADRGAVDEFEMYALSYYQKLNEERSGIISEIYHSGKILSS